MELFLNFYFLPGLILGATYALGAIGITLTFAILRFANFGHGETMTLGAYFCWLLVTYLGISPLLALVPAALLTVMVVLLVNQFFYRPLSGSASVIFMIASFGIMLMVRSAVQFIWGVNVKTMSAGIEKPLSLLGLNILPKHLWILGVSAGLVIGLHLLLSYTRLGKGMRAMSDEPELARLSGINTGLVIKATWVVGAFLAAAAGVFIAIDTQIDPQLGYRLLLPMFAAAILGGLGKPFGAALGGLVIGLVEELSAYPWIGTEPLIDPGYKGAVAFGIMILMLLWRPTGILGGRALT